MRKSLSVTLTVKNSTVTCTSFSKKLLRSIQLLLLVTIGFFISAESFGQGGIAPATPPTGGMNIDGFLQRQGAAGDWLAASGGSPAGTYLFDNNGVAVVGGQIFHLIDKQNDQTDEIFSGGGPNQLGNDPNSWDWSFQKPQAKDDINNALVFLTTDASGNIWVYVTGDRRSTNGTSYLDIEFYQKPISTTLNAGGTGGGFLSLGTNGGRTIGDLDLSLNYTGGGTTATISFLKWINAGTDASPIYQFKDTTVPAGAAFAEPNHTQPMAAYTSVYGLDHYTDSLQFIEAAVNVSALIGAGSTGECAKLPFHTMFIKTKSSASPTATLKDFIAPLSINVCFDHTAPTLNGQGANATINCPATPTFTAPTAADNCTATTALNVTSSDQTTAGSCPSNYSIKRTWSVSDECGNTTTKAQTITVVDNQAPSIGGQGANATIECTGSPSFTAPTASDLCSGATVQNLGDVTSGNSCTKVTTRSWRAVDGCGNISTTVSQTITQRDTQAPNIGQAGNNATLECPASPTFTAPTANDACNGATVNQVGADVTGGTACARTITRTWNAVDGCGNTSVTRSQTITISDTQAPTIGSAGGPATLECPAAPTFTAPTASDLCNGATVQQVGSDVTGGNSCVKTVTRTWNAVDGCGNTSVTRSQTITISDTQAPTIGSAGGPATLECPASPTFTAPTASDACNGATVNQVGSDVTGGNSCVRTITRTWNAVDGCGNTSGTRSQTITIRDTQAPTIGSAGGPATLECPASPTFTAPTASDACNGATVNQVGSDVTGGNSCVRTITRTWNAVDGCGNTSGTRSQTITISDTQAPTIGQAGGSATLECPAAPTFTAPTASDACNGATVNQVGGDVTGGNACARTITRTWNAVDACGNTSGTRSQTITLTDTQAPTIGQAGGPATLECPASPTFTAPTASDLCDGATVQIVGADVTGGNSCVRTITRTWNAVDICGNTSVTRSQTITISDTQAPTIGSAGGPATLECPASPTFTAPTASDACNGATVNQVGSDVTGGNSCVKTVTRTWNAVDGCGNTSGTRSQTITIRDTQAPTIGSAGGPATLECPASPTFTAPTASDVCNGATVNQVGSDVTGGNSCVRTITRTWNAVDGCGNTSGTRSQTITISDTQAPTIGQAGGNATIECPAAPTFTAPTASDACNGATVNQVGADVTGGNACARTITRTWNAVDGCGNTSGTRSQTITITDTQAPTIGQAGGPATLECPASPTFTAPTASDVCDGATVQIVGADVTGGNSCVRTITRTWNAVDICGNTSVTRSQTITISDTQAPTIGSAGGPATLECPASPTFTAPTASDACNGATVNQVGSDVTGGNSCVRTITRTWNAVDGCGNTSGTRSQTITISDTQAPTIGQAGGPATLECPASPTFTAPTASDACNGATVNQVGGDVTGGNSCVKTVTRTWNAVDACGNTSVTRSQTITIRDTQAPTIGQAGGNATIECPAVPTFTAPTASDLCNGATVNQVGSDVTGGNAACAKTITRTWNAVDACGNTSVTRSQTITIVDTQAPTIGQAGGPATLECPASPTFTAPTASDACDGATVNQVGSDVTGGNSCARTITRTWNAVDICGNTSVTRSQTITIVDTQAPVIGQAGGAATLECPASPTFTAPTASDACDGATVNQVGSDVTGGNSCVRTITRTWNAVDICGNTSVTRSQTITIRDTQAPTIGQAGGAATLECPASPTFTAPTASDACNGATVNQVGGDVTGGNSCVKTVTRTWNAVDACGNTSATRSQTITIRDTQAPTIGQAGGAATLECPASPTFTAPTASDACNGATVNQVGGDVTGGNACARTVTRTWNAVDACGNTSATRSQTITIVDHTAPTIGDPGANATINCPSTPSFTPPTASDACSGATVNQVSDVTSGNLQAYTETICWAATDACGNQSNTVCQTITVRCGYIVCSYTQGFWGNKNGLKLLTQPGGILSTQLVIGTGPHSVLIPAGSGLKVNQIMPGGNSPDSLQATTPAQCSILSSCFSVYLTSQGKINNVLLSQTITLALNVRLNNGILKDVPLGSGCLLIGNDTLHLNSTVMAYLGNNAKVSDLLALANALLGGALHPGNGVPSYSDVNDAVTAINEGFDECKMFFGNCIDGNAPVITGGGKVTTEVVARPLDISAYPNPFSTKVTFVISSPVSGQGYLSLYNMFGNIIQTVPVGQVFSGVNQTFEYTPPASYKGTLFYTVRVGGKQASGKLIKVE